MCLCLPSCPSAHVVPAARNTLPKGEHSPLPCPIRWTGLPGHRAITPQSPPLVLSTGPSAQRRGRGRVRGSRPKEPGWPARPPDKAPWTPTLKMRCRGRSLISEHHLERHVDPKGQQCKAATSKALAKEEMRRQGHLPQKHPPCSPKLLYT